MVTGALDEGHPLAVALRLLSADVPVNIEMEPRSWQRWAVLLPRALAAITHLDENEALEGRLQQDASWLLDRAGAYLRVHGRPSDALPLLERALAIDEVAYGPDHPDVATRLSSLVLALRDQGLPDQAQALLERSRAVNRAAEAERGAEELQ